MKLHLLEYLISNPEAKLFKKEFNLNKIAVIAGVGVKNYYKKLGYKLKDEYMVKQAHH